MMRTSDTLDPRGRTEWVMVPAVVGLVAFYYLARADVIAVSSLPGAWTPVTAPSVPAWLHFAAAALLLGVLPLAAARLATGRPLPALGLGAGRWREGLAWLAAGVPLAVVAGYTAAGNPGMQDVYPLYPEAARAGSFWRYAALEALYYGAWEVLFRGVLLFGLRDAVGDRAANLIQTALSVTAHFGRALMETAAALPAGLAFGAVALRTRSVWYGAVIHWTVGIAMDWFLLHGSG